MKNPTPKRNSSKRSTQSNQDATAGFEPANNDQETLSRREPSHEEIAALAQDLYEQEGRPAGRAEAHWHEALRRLRQQRGHGGEGYSPARDEGRLASA
jgi:hypothetical protein